MKFKIIKQNKEESMNRIMQISITAVTLIFGALLCALRSMAQQGGQTGVQLKPYRLVKVSQQTLFFSDRPVRIAGHYKMVDYLKTWSEGKDNFGEDPPN